MKNREIVTPECEDSPAENRHEIVAVIKGRREGEVVSGFGEDEISESRSLLLTYQRRTWQSCDNHSMNGYIPHDNIIISNLKIDYTIPNYRKKDFRFLDSYSKFNFFVSSLLLVVLLNFHGLRIEG